MPEAIRRRILGISALTLLCVSPFLWFGSSRPGVQTVGGMAFKAGLAFGAAWLAIGYLLFIFMERRARQTGSIGQY